MRHKRTAQAYEQSQPRRQWRSERHCLSKRSLPLLEKVAQCKQLLALNFHGLRILPGESVGPKKRNLQLGGHGNSDHGFSPILDDINL
jgi:hypothetical protein